MRPKLSIIHYYFEMQKKCCVNCCNNSKLYHVIALKLLFVSFSSQNFHSGTKSLYYQYSCISKITLVMIQLRSRGVGEQNEKCIFQNTGLEKKHNAVPLKSKLTVAFES